MIDSKHKLDREYNKRIKGIQKKVHTAQCWLACQYNIHLTRKKNRDMFLGMIKDNLGRKLFNRKKQKAL